MSPKIKVLMNNRILLSLKWVIERGCPNRHWQMPYAKGKSQGILKKKRIKKMGSFLDSAA